MSTSRQYFASIWLLRHVWCFARIYHSCMCRVPANCCASITSNSRHSIASRMPGERTDLFIRVRWVSPLAPPSEMSPV